MNTKHCIFCRKGPVTTEDIWGTWIGDDLGRREGVTTTWTHGTDVVEHKVFRHRAYTGKADIVCRKCNNTWMSRIEKAGSVILKRMFDEKGEIEFTSDERRILATWAMKQALTVQYLGSQRVIPVQVYREFFKFQCPPQLTLFALSRYETESDVNGSHSHGGIVREEVPGKLPVEYVNVANVYGVTINVFRVVIQVIGFWARDTRLLGMFPPENFAEYQQVFWPISGVPNYWPPRGPSLDEAGVLALGAALRQNMPFIPLAD